MLYGKSLCCLYFARAGADSVCPTRGYKEKSKWRDRPLTWMGRMDIRVPVAPLGFPCSSVGKESACNAGELGSIPGLGRSPGEGNGTHSCLESPRDRGAWQLQSMASQESDTT